MNEVKKAIIPLGGMATRFLPLSKAVPKELLPLADIPVIQYLVKEARDSGIEEIIFVLSANNKNLLDYFKSSSKLEKILKERKKDQCLSELKEFDGLFEGMTFSYVIQKEPLGDGHAILQAAKLVKDEPVAVMFGDDVLDGPTPGIAQLMKMFKTCQKPIIGAIKLPKEDITAYGCLKVEKIANRFYKVKGIIEKPKVEEAPSNLAICGKYIITPEVMQYLKKAKPTEKGEIIMAEVINNHMIKEGKLIYAYEFEGKWLECGDKLKWMESNLYFSLNHPKYGPELREYIKKI